MKIKQKWTSLLKKNNKSLAEFKGNYPFLLIFIGLKSMDSEGSERSYKSKKSNASGMMPQDF